MTPDDAQTRRALMEIRSAASEMRFGDYLRTRRAQRNWSVRELLERLAAHDHALFADLHVVTVSNWENHKQFPRREHRLGLVSFFADDAGLWLPIFARHRVRREPRPGMRAVAERLFRSIRGRQFADFATATDSNYKMVTIGTTPDCPWLRQDILNFDHAVYQPAQPVTLEVLANWAKFPSATVVACTHVPPQRPGVAAYGPGTMGRSYEGHLVALRLQQPVYQSLIAGRMDEACIAASHCAADGE
ncbi:MAG: hypothetical protein FJX64_09315 [Alphaproteobacteria bacterium]|nr:hypothetical protein [Alphaproteobacteria bacterium]MBM4437934.1 hypothetical protein [Actinomycetota bacterium]